MTLRERLAKLAEPSELAKHLPMACRASAGVEVLAVRSAGVAVDEAARDELLAKCAAGKYVELELDVLAFEQEPGKRNRNSIRLGERALPAAGKTGRGNPFLRDHRQGDVTARCGTVLKSETKKLGDGHFVIQQTVRLTAPWAVDLALRGLLDTVSIGWRPTGPVMCSACNAPIFSVCWHTPGDRLAEEVDKRGSKRLVRATDGDVVVEWIFTAFELVETSAVSVPAVPSAHIESIRAALAAHIPGFTAELADVGDVIPQENDMDPKLLLALGLALTATVDDAVTRATALTAERDLARQERDTARTELTGATAQLELMKGASAKSKEDEFIASAIGEGKVIPASAAEESVRKWFRADEAAARAYIAAAPSVTPAGTPPQRGPKTPPPSPKDGSATDHILAEHGFNPAVVKAQLKQLGVKDPDASLARRYAQQEA